MVITLVAFTSIYIYIYRVFEINSYVYVCMQFMCTSVCIAILYFEKIAVKHFSSVVCPGKLMNETFFIKQVN